jgi:hypothetical protein
MRIEPEKMLKKHGIAARGLHEESIARGSLDKVAPLDVRKVSGRPQNPCKHRACAVFYPLAPLSLAAIHSRVRAVLLMVLVRPRGNGTENSRKARAPETR